MTFNHGVEGSSPSALTMTSMANRIPAVTIREDSHCCGSRTFWVAGSEKGQTRMYVVAGILVALSGLFYAADQGQIGSLGKTMCNYGETFCRHPVYVLVGAGIAAAWGTFVSIK
ncbi:hypothetical protein HMPREF9695_01910 [Afipia broomeae ATCC 49717]|uniref:Uncharacterized protein n=1 Tax=Afipia broomeae ATCC 49717 TaxID=883078 RepID=K8PER6_9BRAD|nr:hypothetical protein HMPREF9695_01910 [Afipia broomeae ATCC 49717]